MPPSTRNRWPDKTGIWTFVKICPSCGIILGDFAFNKQLVPHAISPTDVILGLEEKGHTLELGVGRACARLLDLSSEPLDCFLFASGPHNWVPLVKHSLTAANKKHSRARHSVV